MVHVHKFEYPTLDLAWEGINEYLVNHEKKIRERGGATYGTEMVCYDSFIHVYKSTVRPDFNFGKILGYKFKKWSKLVNNYVNFNYLDLVKSEVVSRESKKAKHYNYTFHFDNAHGSGKDCLIALSFCRRQGQENPFVIYTTRASEATSRLIFDFLLIQRIVEYVYGKDKTVEVLCYIPFVFVNVERFLIYMAYKGEDCVVKKDGEYSPYQKRVVTKYHEFLNKPIEQIKYKVHRRAAMQVKKDGKGNPIANAPDLFAKDLHLLFNKNKLKTKDIEKLNKSYDDDATN